MPRLDKITHSVSHFLKDFRGIFESPNSIQKCSSKSFDTYYNLTVEKISTQISWSNVVASGDMLVTSSGSRKEIVFWTALKHAGSAPWTQTCKTIINEGVSQMKFWNSSGKRTVVCGSWQGSIILLACDGKILAHEAKAHKDCVTAICIWDNKLVTADIHGNIKIWDIDAKTLTLNLTRTLEHSSMICALQAVDNNSRSSFWTAGNSLSMWSSSKYHKTDLLLSGQESLVTSLCKWRQWVVTGCMNGAVGLWDSKGRIEKQFNFSGYIGNLAEWKEHLCVGLLSKILVVDISGICIAEIEGQGSQNMAVCQGKLITSTVSEILVYHRKCSWVIAKQMWIGHFKELPENCDLASLPRDMIHLILAFV